MPAVSQAQRAYLNMRFGHAWVKKHHFANKGKLPAHKSHFAGASIHCSALAAHKSRHGIR
jgi:hypothetical protein